MVKDNFVKPQQLKNISQTLFFAIIEVIGEGLRKAINVDKIVPPNQICID